MDMLSVMKSSILCEFQLSVVSPFSSALSTATSFSFTSGCSTSRSVCSTPL